VLFVGLDRIFEIWNPDTFEPVEAARLEEMRRLYDAGDTA
jgi:DNA-binding transcriptional regulator/RsmH inhibitor MraZ